MAATRSKTAQLAVLARAAGCGREPYYVRRPIAPGLERIFPVEGWYWRPPGAAADEFLAGRFTEAYYSLRRRLEDQLSPAEPGTAGRHPGSS